MTRSPRWAARRWCGPSPTTSRPTTSRNSWRGRRPCRTSSTTATPDPAACRIWCRRSFSTAPACRPCRCRSRAAVPAAQAVAGGHRRRGRCRPCRSPRPRSRASSSKACSSPAPSARRRCRTCRRCKATSASSPRTSTWNSGGACLSRRARRSRSGPRLEKALQDTMANPAVRERLHQGRHRSVVRAWPGAQGQARERDQELVEVHRRQGHQGRAIGCCSELGRA